jgi:hypothetical protein
MRIMILIGAVSLLAAGCAGRATVRSAGYYDDDYYVESYPRYRRAPRYYQQDRYGYGYDYPRSRVYVQPPAARVYVQPPRPRVYARPRPPHVIVRPPRPPHLRGPRHRHFPG